MPGRVWVAPMSTPARPPSANMIMGMPPWGLVAAGLIPDGDPGAPGELHTRLAAILSDTRFGCALSSLQVDDPRAGTTTLTAPHAHPAGDGGDPHGLLADVVPITAGAA